MGRGPMQSAGADLLIVQRIGNIIQNHRQNKLNRRDEREFAVHAGLLCDCWNNRRRLHVLGDDNSFRREEERVDEKSTRVQSCQNGRHEEEEYDVDAGAKRSRRDQREYFKIIWEIMPLKTTYGHECSHLGLFIFFLALVAEVFPNLEQVPLKICLQIAVI